MIDAGTFFGDPDRAGSGEVDFGVWWSEDAQRYPRWRVSWIEKTGELYAVSLDHGAVSRVEIFGSFGSRDRVEAALAGWEDECEKPGSLKWIRSRV